jgi:UDP-3-O-acyl N-acetylglucosamine deacetylase
MKQRTISREVSCAGIGLHTGAQVTMTLQEGQKDSGIVFVRTDLPGAPEVRAHVRNVVNVERCTILGRDSMRIATVEHFLAACYGLGIDNLKVLIDGEEVPALDGSARLFCDCLLGAGVKEQEKERETLTLTEPLSVRQGSALLVALPWDGLKLTGIIDFPHPMVGTQMYECELDPSHFVSELAPSRTFGFWEEVESLLARGLARGGSFDNAVVIRQDGFSTALRFPDELVRHKCLDLLGDIALAGKRVSAHLISLKAGHALHREMMQKIQSLEVKHAGSRGDKKDTASSLSISTGG